jgi:threonine synthase
MTTIDWIGSPTSDAVDCLVCQSCGERWEIHPGARCATCGGSLEVSYHLERLAEVTAESIAAGPQSMWRYAGLLPVSADSASWVDAGIGLTPLIRADELGSRLGFTAPLWIKDESANLTHSFKDRAVSVAMTVGRAMGYKRFACASTGNLAASVAALAARAGAESVVFVPAGTEAAKVAQASVYGGAVIGIEGTYDDVNALCRDLLHSPEFRYTAVINVNLRAFYAEGSKTLAFEVAEQLGWRQPGQVVAPMASGAMLTKIDKGFRELRAVGLVEGTRDVRVHGAQSAGCAPIVTAFDSGAESVSPVVPTGIAKALNIGNPANGGYALDVVRRTGGAMAAADEDEIRAAIRLLAETTGVFTEPAGGVTLAALIKLVRQGKLDTNSETVVYITADGLKSIDTVATDALVTVPPSVDELIEVLPR